MRMRQQLAAIIAVAAIVVGAMFAVFVPAAPAHAWGGGTVVSGVGGSPASITAGGSNSVPIYLSTGTQRGKIDVAAGVGGVMFGAAGGTDPGFRAQSGAYASAGLGGAGTIGTKVFCAGKSLTASSAGTDLFCVDGAGVTQMITGVTASNNLAGTSACAASGDVGKEVLYSDTSTSKITLCACEQTAAATFAWGAVTASGDCS